MMGDKNGKINMEFSHELIIPNEGMPFKLFPFEGMKGNYIREKHWHTSMELFFVLEGSLFVSIHDMEFPLHEKELVIINSNEIHSIRAPLENKTIVLQIPLEQFSSYFTAQGFIRFRNPARVRMKDSRPNEEQLASLMEKMYTIYAAKETGYEFQTMALYYDILYLLVREYRETNVAEKEIKDNKHLKSLSGIISYMREHYREDIKLTEVAEKFGYSEAYLSRMFKKYVHINFKTYLQEIRMAYAYRELMNTDHAIGQIAMKHGFADSRAFCREFLKRYHMRPSEMEKRSKNSYK